MLMFNEIEATKSTIEACRLLILMLNSKGVTTSPELPHALESISSLKDFIEKNSNEDIQEHFDEMDWEIEENVGLTLLMCIVLPKNANRLWFESFDDGSEEEITEELINDIALSTNGEWKLSDLEIEMDEEEDVLYVSFTSFEQEHQWELESPIVDDLVIELKRFSDDYLKKGKLFINPTEEEIPIFYLPETLVTEMDKEFSVEF